MPHCCAFGCSNESKNKKVDSITFHWIPGEDRKHVRNKWKNLPKHVYLCSEHFDASCFNESADIRYHIW